MTDYTLNNKIPLTSTQNEVVEWMLQRPSCINACQTGLGKTYTTLTAITHLLLKYPKLVAIICVPPKALKVFRKELETKLRTSYTEISSQNKKSTKSRIVLTTHTKLPDLQQQINDLIKNDYKIAFILDEAHILQNNQSKVSKMVYKNRQFFSIFWCLTATPCGNDIYGLYNLMHIVNPKVLGTPTEFKNNYLITDWRKVKQWNNITHRYEFPVQEVVIGCKNTKELQEHLKDYLIIKQKHYNLKYEYHTTNLDSDEIIAYLNASAGLARKTSEKNFAVRLNDLQRVVDNSSEKYSDASKLSSKEKLLIETTLNLVKEHAIIVYTDLQDNIDRLHLLFTKLKQMKYPINNIYKVTGAQSFEERAIVEDRLMTSDIVLITSAGTESINLQAADTIILYDAPFSIKTYIQLIGRVTRIDTKHPEQTIHFIECSGTVDTYKRLCIIKHADIINQLFGEIETLPLDLVTIDENTQSKLRNKLLWSFRQRRLPTEAEINQILDTN